MAPASYAFAEFTCHKSRLSHFHVASQHRLQRDKMSFVRRKISRQSMPCLRGQRFLYRYCTSLNCCIVGADMRVGARVLFFHCLPCPKRRFLCFLECSGNKITNEEATASRLILVLSTLSLFIFFPRRDMTGLVETQCGRREFHTADDFMAPLSARRSAN